MRNNSVKFVQLINLNINHFQTRNRLATSLLLTRPKELFFVKLVRFGSGLYVYDLFRYRPTFV